MSRLADALFTTTQQKVLGLLYSSPERSFYTKQIIRTTGMGVATIKRELDRMLAAGIIDMTKLGNQHHYQADKSCPIYEELSGIVKKTFGITDVIREALSPFTDQIDWAFIFGSVASGRENASSDIDLMIIGDADFSELVAALYPVQEALGREINPKIFRRDEWMLKREGQDTFVIEVLAKPRMDVIGDGYEPGELARD
ncbi:MAG: nucleotidyltransferase domain-containing protein [Candidatus Thiodiazotropha taylori]|nr:nucleotidyltransferase domain-containing protein [Candidatus Thiodiazotropha taylori]